MGVDSTASTDGTDLADPAVRLALVAYHASTSDLRIEPAPRSREWSAQSSAKRCLPLTIGNQSGWMLLNPAPFRAIWDGGNAPGAITIEYPDGVPDTGRAFSAFGHGVLSFSIPYLFRTPPSYNMQVRGPANCPKDGISPLDGIVETDWAVVSFTMNWKLTRPGLEVSFAADEPFCMLVPQRRGDIERFDPVIRDIRTSPEAAHDAEQWKAWIEGRAREQRAQWVAEQFGAQRKLEFDQSYLRGFKPDGEPAPEHRKSVDLAPFVVEDD